METNELMACLWANDRQLTIVSLEEPHLRRMGRLFQFGEALEQNTTVQQLNLWYYDRVGEFLGGLGGALPLAVALSRNTTLTSREFYACGIRPDSASVIAAAMEANTTVTSLDLWNNDLGEQSFGQVLNCNSTLRSLHLASTNMNVNAARVLAAALGSQSTLRTEPSNNNLGADGAESRVLCTTYCVPRTTLLFQ